MLFCVKCGAGIREGAGFCPKCGASVRKKEEAAAPPENKQAFCAHCGAAMKAGVEFCPKCRMPSREKLATARERQRARQAPEEAAQVKNKKTRTVLIVAAAALAVTAVALIVLLLTNAMGGGPGVYNVKISEVEMPAGTDAIFFKFTNGWTAYTTSDTVCVDDADGTRGIPRGTDFSPGESIEVRVGEKDNLNRYPIEMITKNPGQTSAASSAYAASGADDSLRDAVAESNREKVMGGMEADAGGDTNTSVSTDESASTSASSGTSTDWDQAPAGECRACGGSGKEVCGTCLGLGQVRGRGYTETRWTTCYSCGGTGWHECSVCHGTGRIG